MYSIEEEKAHIERTIKGLQARYDELVSGVWSDPIPCPFCATELEHVDLADTYTQLDVYRATWDGRAKKWKIDPTNKTNSESVGHAWATICAVCDRELNIEGTPSPEGWIDPSIRAIVPPSPPTEEAVDLVGELFAMCNRLVDTDGDEGVDGIADLLVKLEVRDV